MTSLYLRESRGKCALLTVAALTLIAGSANASLTASLADNTVVANTNGTDYLPPDSSVINFNAAQGSWNGVSVTSLSKLSDDEVLFRNGVVASGLSTNLYSTTGLNITFTNDLGLGEGTSVTPVLRSTLLAAGLGVYLSAALSTMPGSGNPCSSASLAGCGTPTATQAANLGGTEAALGPYHANAAGFIFDVSVGGASIYSLKGEMGIDGGGNYYQDFGLGSSGDASQILHGFQMTSATNDPLSHTFSWDDTAVDITLPALANGASETATYTITTYAITGSNSSSLYGTFDPDLGTTVASAIAYSSFGDPVGRGGVIGSQLTGFSDFVKNATSDATGGVPAITGLDNTAVGHFRLSQGHYDPQTGEYVASLDGSTYVDPTVALDGTQAGSVPEPASWALMLGGFGLTGGSLRRKRTSLA